MEQEHHLYLIVRYEILGQKRRLSVQNLILASTGRQENSVHLLCTTLWFEMATILCRIFLVANNLTMSKELFGVKSMILAKFTTFGSPWYNHLFFSAGDFVMKTRVFWCCHILDLSIVLLICILNQCWRVLILLKHKQSDSRSFLKIYEYT